MTTSHLNATNMSWSRSAAIRMLDSLRSSLSMTRAPSRPRAAVGLRDIRPSTALSDVLRLSKGMSYKNIMAGLPYGGGKAVIMANPRTEKTRALLTAFAEQVR
jgi:glutamate dehydrogenase/leucine dehydrogenase